MMRIPILPMTSDLMKNLYTGELVFDGFVPDIKAATAYKMDVTLNRKIPVLLVDVNGLKKKTINSTVLKHIKTRGSRTWFLTHIESAEDVFDAFNTDADSVLFPTHTIKSVDVFSDILSISDSVIPAIFVNHGKTQDGKAVIDEFDFLYEIGFTSVAIFDLDMSLTFDNWLELSKKGFIIPYSKKFHDSVFESIGMPITFNDS